jgi:beta-lactam-binding protein with PASTA domain
MSILTTARNGVVIGKGGNPNHGNLQTVGLGKAVANKTVPTVTGLSYAAALSAAATATLGLNPTGNFTVGLCVSQSPAATTSVPTGFTIIANWAP